MSTPSRDDMIPEIISEFSQMFAAARSRWARNAEDVDPGLRGPGMMILQTILRRGPVTATGLGNMLDMDKAYVSRQVAKLRELGLVEATEAEQDRRVTLLTGSQKAQEAMEELRARSAADYRARFGEWSDEELAILHTMLHRFNSTTEDLRGDGPARRCAREAGQPEASGHRDPLR